MEKEETLEKFEPSGSNSEECLEPHYIFIPFPIAHSLLFFNIRHPFVNSPF